MSQDKQLDIRQNRNSHKYTRKEILLRILWGFIKPMFRFSPRIAFSWRNFILRIFGARIGKEVHIYNSAQIYMPWNFSIGDYSAVGEQCHIYNLAMVTIGCNSTISQRAHLCGGTHSHTSASLELVKLPIVIADNVWVAADAFISPGIEIREGAIVGARAVVTKDIEAWTIVAGNPAKFIKQRVLNEE